MHRALLRGLVIVALSPMVAFAQGLPPLAHGVVGGTFEYTVQKGDTFESIGSRKGVETAVLAKLNGLKPTSSLKAGQVIRGDNAHVVPADLDDGILVNLPQRKLFLIRNAELVSAYPVAPGKPAFKTPTGGFQVLQMRENPTWYVPASIQQEWARAGKVLKKAVPPGPGNPLGGYWIGMSFPSYGIHGTNAPLSIYDFQSRGCVRMLPDDAGDLFRRVKVGDSGEIIYEPALLARLPDGRIFLEVHSDVYKKQTTSAIETTRALADSSKLTEAIDWSQVTGVAKVQDGIAHQVGSVGPATAK
jgi:L,D-transpeptidase ErfK/SrfK